MRNCSVFNLTYVIIILNRSALDGPVNASYFNITKN